jgi:hypothetical protein
VERFSWATIGDQYQTFIADVVRLKAGQFDS